MSVSSRLFNIPSGANFLAELAKGVRARYAKSDDPFALADCLILLPTRRAIRGLERAFAPAPGEPGVLLPKMRALGDWDGGDGEADDPSTWAGRELTPPPMSPVERQLALMEMVLAWAGRKAPVAERLPMDPALALGLAQDLCTLFDAAAAERMDWTKLRDLVPNELALHWEQTLDFLKILTEEWPNWLNARGRSDPAQHRDDQMKDLARHWTAKPPAFPVIIAGSTGSVKATQELMRAVLAMPRGAVILPGIDRGLDRETWDILGPDHPQFVMKQLLAALGHARSDVEPWTGAPGTPERAALLSEVMRPAAATGLWREFVSREKDGAAHLFNGITWVESAAPNAEALTIATILRESLEAPGATAALITPNRNLARRVASQMRRWSVETDDSAGRPLSKTPLGGFLALIMQAMAEEFAPVPLLALLKHPFCTLGWPPEDRHRIVLNLERAGLRGPRPAPGLSGTIDALAADADPMIARLLQRLKDAFAPLGLERTQGLAQWTTAIRNVADALNQGDGAIWADETGLAAARLFDEIEAIPFLDGAYGFSAAARVLDRLMDGTAVRLRSAASARVDILGPLEARLQTADVVVLGGLNEPGWPGLASVDGWLSRPMRKDLDLSAPERRIGQSAHDFAEAACAPRVFLSRALKEEGGPANPSRWLVRLEALAKALGQDVALRDAQYTDWAAALDRPQTFDKIEPPSPKPPVHARARSLYVTAVEQWVRDPYAHYVRRILNLAPLDLIDQDPSAREKGTFIHRALELFVLRYPCEMPPDAPAILEELGREAAREQKVPPGVVALWWPRFRKIVAWFAAEETARRPLLANILTEVKGQALLLDLNFTLSAKADRIEIRRAGGVAILDYKTGYAPTQDELETGLSSQFPLEAWIAMQGGFPDVDPGAVPDFMALRLTGKGAGGEIKTYENVPDLVSRAIAGLKKRIATFDDPETGYPSKVAVKFQRYADDFDYIARAAETALDAEESSS